jgi:hypothetical protein
MHHSLDGGARNRRQAALGCARKGEKMIEQQYSFLDENGTAVGSVWATRIEQTLSGVSLYNSDVLIGVAWHGVQNATTLEIIRRTVVEKKENADVLG